MNAKFRFVAKICSIFLMCAHIAIASETHETNTLRTYPVPRALFYGAHNNDFTVRVRTPGGKWQDLYEYRIRVDMNAPQNASMVYFDFRGRVELEIEKNNGDFRRVEVSPRSSSLKPKVYGSVVRLTLDHPERFSLQFDGDRLHNIHILTGDLPSAQNIPPDAPNVRRFGPGLHTPPEGRTTFAVASGERIYLEGGAVLKGTFDLTDVHDVKITGRGLIYDPGRSIDLNRASDIDISGLILVNTERAEAARVMNIRNSKNVVVRDISGFTAGKWSDGINISTSQHVRVEDGYLRVSDDALVVYAVTDCPICRETKILPTGPDGAHAPANTFDIRVRNMRIWNDVAHAMFVGHFGDNSAPREIHDVSFDSIDVMNLDERQPEWEGVMAIFSGDSTYTHDIAFSNIRVDRIIEGKLINFVAGLNPQYNKAPGRGIENVTIKNVTFTGEGMPGASIIAGTSPETAIKNVTIEKMHIGTRKVRTPKDADIEVGPFVSGLSIRP